MTWVWFLVSQQPWCQISPHHTCASPSGAHGTKTQHDSKLRSGLSQFCVGWLVKHYLGYITAVSQLPVTSLPGATSFSLYSASDWLLVLPHMNQPWGTTEQNKAQFTASRGKFEPPGGKRYYTSNFQPMGTEATCTDVWLECFDIHVGQAIWY